MSILTTLAVLLLFLAVSSQNFIAASSTCFHSSLGRAYAGLGRKEEAIREGLLSANQFPMSKDAVTGSYLTEELATIYVMVGEYDAALNLIDSLLSCASQATSVAIFRLDPRWDPLRDHPRFVQQGFSNLSMLYVNGGADADYTFTEERQARGIRFQETHSDPAFVDYDNDGDLDLSITCIYEGVPSALYQRASA